MKLTNREILDFLNLDLVNKKLPVRLAYAVALNIETFRPVVNAYSKSRMDLVNRYAKKDETGNPATKDGHYVFDDIIGWNKAIDELLDVEVDVKVSTVKESDLDKCDDPLFDRLSVNEIIVMGFMIEK